MKKVRVGLVGAKFISSIHYEALRTVPAVEILAVASRSMDSARAFAGPRGIPHAFGEVKQLLEMPEIDVVVLGCPNDLHCSITVQAASAGKHVICEKPLAMNLAEADQMIAACQSAGVKLMYAEELCFAPKYVRLKKLVDDGALGQVNLIKQSEKHDGPHADWFWDVERSGGGVTLDMGCHGIEFARWLLRAPNGQKPEITSVYADMRTSVHPRRTRGDDNAILILNFDNGVTALIEESWSKLGGMDDRAEVYGSDGVAFADLLRGNSIHTYSRAGYDYAVEKGGSTTGWSFTIYEEAWNYGFPQEMAHFVDCIRHDLEPLETGEDGRVVLEAIFAAYASAGSGKRISLPFKTDAARPIDLWKPKTAP
ncbi:MAG: Gfo/Idh/MocA family oxidoreductase [Planctomycetota bacterium]